MLIRSQDKKKLLNMDNICCIDVANMTHRKEYHVFATLLDDQVDIGAYKTEDKAIKVLDGIQNEYLKSYDICLDKFTTKSLDRERPIVFQMPQDKEVE